MLIKDHTTDYGEEMLEELNLLEKAKITITRRKRSRGLKIPRRRNEFNQDLGTVIEEESIPDSEMNSAFKSRDPRTLYTKFDCETYLLTKVIEACIYEQSLLLADSLVKVHSVLLMWIHKRRFY